MKLEVTREHIKTPKGAYVWQCERLNEKGYNRVFKMWEEAWMQGLRGGVSTRIEHVRGSKANTYVRGARLSSHVSGLSTSSRTGSTSGCGVKNIERIVRRYVCMMYVGCVVCMLVYLCIWDVYVLL